MKRAFSLPLVALALAACSDSTTNPVADAPRIGVSLSSVHLKGGANAEPVFTDLGLALRSSGALSGLGNGDIFVFMSATGNGTAVCSNPSVNDGKDQQPAGQNPAPITLSGGQFIPSADIDKNGNVPFLVTTAPPPNNPRAATKQECPSANWLYTITDLAWTSATIRVYQPSTGDPSNPGLLVLTVSCTFSPPTVNGTVPATRVSCTQV